MPSTEIEWMCCFCNERKVCRKISKEIKANTPPWVYQRSSRICSTCRKNWKTKLMVSIFLINT